MKRIELKSEVTGSVWKILVKLGDLVEAGDDLIIIESMKMEIPVQAEESGTIVEMRVIEGAPVNDGDIVIVMEK